MSNHETNLEGRNKVEAELRKRGASVESKSIGALKIRLFATDAGRRRTVELHVRAKTKGCWHAKIDEAQPISVPPDPQHARNFSVFVDLGAAPRYWIVPHSWLGVDIHKAHQEYLRKHGGHRAQNDGSNHHAIQESRLAEWENRWDVLGIF